MPCVDLEVAPSVPTFLERLALIHEADLETSTSTKETRSTRRGLKDLIRAAVALNLESKSKSNSKPKPRASSKRGA